MWKVIWSYAICMTIWLEDKRIKNELRLLLKISSLVAEKWYARASNDYLAKYFDVSKKTISIQLSKLQKLWYLHMSYKYRWAEIINRQIYLQNNENSGLQKCNSTDYKNVIDNSISKHNNISNNIHSSNEEVLISSFWLSMIDIEKMFNHKKSLETILNMCSYIKIISNRLWIIPIYNKDTINATNIMRNNLHLNDIDEFIERIRDWWVYDGWDYQELIRSDYYLPYELDDL
jgi:predicted transcriptional regulator